MAGSDDSVLEYPGKEQKGSSDPPNSQPPRDVIEYDPDAPRMRPSIQMVSSIDTIAPGQDYFSARDELQTKFAGLKSILRTYAAATVETAGNENVVGVGVGFRYAANSLTSEMAVKVYVREKLPMQRIALAAQIPTAIAGIPTDVEQTGDILLHSYAKRYPRPVPCGVSVGHVKLPGSGTLRCLVVLRNRRLCLLSNNHVLANENDASQGDHVIQPGNAEPVSSHDEVIGVLERFVPIQATGNRVDAAVAWTSSRFVKREHVTYQVDPNPVAATLGLTVMKNGRTTQSTLGMVTDLGVNILVGYRPFPQGAEMRDQIAIRGVSGPFSKPGDSGSLIVTASARRPVGLLFAGASDNSITFANPIDAVMTELEIERFA